MTKHFNMYCILLNELGVIYIPLDPEAFSSIVSLWVVFR